MLALGTAAPGFVLPDTISRRMVSLDELARGASAVVVMFLCNHCPYVKHVNAEIVRLAKEYQPHGIAFVGISSNDVERFPEDSPDEMHRVGIELGYPFPYLYDESQEVARAYQAACTPEFYIFDRDRALVYRGQLDDSRPSNGAPVTGQDVRDALGDLLAGRSVSEEQTPSIGCSIKWRQS
jgi:thiol-disulfide isomerase/thioredoxin